MTVRQGLCDHFVGKSTYTTLIKYLALFKGDPIGAGVEVSGGSYARQSLPASLFNAADVSGACLSNANLDFPAATTEWAPEGDKITHYAVYSASSGGTLLSSGPVPVPKAIASGDTFRVSAGNLKFTIADPA